MPLSTTCISALMLSTLSAWDFIAANCAFERAALAAAWALSLLSTLPLIDGSSLLLIAAVAAARLSIFCSISCSQPMYIAPVRCMRAIRPASPTGFFRVSPSLLSSPAPTPSASALSPMASHAGWPSMLVMSFGSGSGLPSLVSFSWVSAGTIIWPIASRPAGLLVPSTRRPLNVGAPAFWPGTSESSAIRRPSMSPNGGMAAFCMAGPSLAKLSLRSISEGQANGLATTASAWADQKVRICATGSARLRSNGAVPALPSPGSSTLRPLKALPMSSASATSKRTFWCLGSSWV